MKRSAKWFVSVLLALAVFLLFAEQGYARNIGQEPEAKAEEEALPEDNREDSHDVDLDGDTDEEDAQAILDFLAGLYDDREDELDLDAADVDGDELVSSYDAYLLLTRKEAGNAEDLSGAVIVTDDFEGISVSLLEKVAAHNGLYAIIYDPERMTFHSAVPHADAFCAYKDDAEKEL